MSWSAAAHNLEWQAQQLAEAIDQLTEPKEPVVLDVPSFGAMFFHESLLGESPASERALEHLRAVRYVSPAVSDFVDDWTLRVPLRRIARFLALGLRLTIPLAVWTPLFYVVARGFGWQLQPGQRRFLAVESVAALQYPKEREQRALARLRELGIPVWIVAGSRDRLMPKAAVDAF